MNSSESHRLEAVLLAETVKRIEASAPLDDTDAIQQAAAAESGRQQRLIARATLLGQRLGVREELQAWRGRAALVWLALAALVFFASQSMVQALLGGDRTINAVLAFVAALGAHFLTLVLWLLGLLASRLSPSSAIARLSLGNLGLRLVAWRPARSGSHSAQLVAAALSMLERGRLLPWLFGLVSHVVWAASFLLVLLSLWLGFSFREYRLTWETTILDSSFFTSFIHTTGMLPRLLGFPMPDAALPPSAVNAAATHRALAFWLIGCTFTYGLLPRLVLALLSALVCGRRRHALQLDLADPYYRKLLARFDALDRPQVLDAESPTDSDGSAADTGTGDPVGMPALIGFELPPEYPWPPFAPAAPGTMSINISGAGDQREDVLAQLRGRRPGRILFACDQASSPDRGTARFLRQAGACGGQSAVLLLVTREHGSRYVARWRDWMAESGLEMTLFEDNAAAAAWLGTTDE